MLSSTRDPSMRSIVLSSTGTHVRAQFNYKHIIVQYMLRDPSVRSTLHVYMYTAFPWNIGHQNFRCYSRVTYVIVTCIAQGQGFMPANWPESEGDSPRTRRKFLSTANDCIEDMATALGENSLLHQILLQFKDGWACFIQWKFPHIQYTVVGQQRASYDVSSQNECHFMSYITDSDPSKIWES